MEIDYYQESIVNFYLKLERRIKMIFILPNLLLRKIEGDNELLTS